jgi:hypothetical protein
MVGEVMIFLKGWNTLVFIYNSILLSTTYCELYIPLCYLSNVRCLLGLQPHRHGGLGMVSKVAMNWRIKDKEVSLGSVGRAEPLTESGPRACRTNCAEHTTYRAIFVRVLGRFSPILMFCQVPRQDGELPRAQTTFSHPPPGSKCAIFDY